MTQLHWLSAAQASAAFAAGSTTPAALMEALLARIGRLDPTLNALTALDAENAREEARRATADINGGRRRGALHGIPVALKDIIDAVGFPTACQSRILMDNMPSRDAAVVARLKQAGAIILGKCATWEFANGGAGFDLPLPPARNPWNIAYSPGGSSSGSGAGVAAGLFPISIGTDTGGSIRHPAGACGIVGLKPTYDLVSRDGVFPLAHSVDHVGPMARTVADIALTLDQIAQPHHAVAGRCSSRLGEPIDGLRIGFVRNLHDDGSADPEIVKGLETAAATLEGCGARIVDASLPLREDFEAAYRIIQLSEAWSVHADWLRTRPESYGQKCRARFLTGAFFTAEDYLRAQKTRRKLIKAVEGVLEQVDLLLVIGPYHETALLTDDTPLRQAWMPFSFTGHPALSLMCGLSARGLPLSFQLVGRYYDEAVLLQAAAAFEAASPFSGMHPPIDEQIDA